MKALTRRVFMFLCGSSIAAFSTRGRSFAAAKALLPGAGSGDDPERCAASSQWTENWEYGMVTGNGRMGAVVYGRPESPIVIVNQNRLYTAEYDPAGIGPANTARFVPQIRDLVRNQGYGAALDFAYQKAKENGLAPEESIDFHPGFFLNCNLAGAGQPAEYRRLENFETGEVVTSWRGSAGSFRTRVFVSRADDVVVMSIAGPGPGLLSCSLEIADITNRLIDSSPQQGSDWIGVHNLYRPGNGGYDGAVRVAASGGSAHIENGHVEVRDANEVLLLMRIERYRPPQKGTLDAVIAKLSAVDADYERLLAPHVQIHGGIFKRVELDLGGGADRKLTTDELLDRAATEKTLSTALMEKIYDACRYVILCSSGDLPPNLQGIWTGTWTPPWHSDYSADANLQLAIDSTCSANMPELLNGFFDLVEAGVPSWQEGANKLAGCRGILYPARMQDQGTYFQQNHDWPWFNQIPIAGWLGHYFYDYYRYTGDRAFLERRAIPYLKECALFYEDWYGTGPDGRLRATPSFSYECAWCDNATIECAVVREVLTNLIEGCETLGIEKEGVARWKALLAKVPRYMINTPQTTGGPLPHYKGMDGNGTVEAPDGTLKEFIEANMVEYPNHRHLSSLYPLFVSYEFTPEETPELWKAAELWYERKTSSVRETESHYRMQSSLCAARLGRGNDIWKFLTAMAANGVFHTSLVPSHYDHHRVFNVDASGGIPAVIDNCLVFSLPGQLDLLPALPAAIPVGSIQGILARGQITIHRLAWDMKSRTVAVELTSSIEQKINIGLPPDFVDGVLALNGKRQPIVRPEMGKHLSTVTLRKGRTMLQVQEKRG